MKNNKYFLYVIFIISCFLIFDKKVEAVINGGINNGNKNYVIKDATNYGDIVTSGGYLGVSYEVIGNSDASSFCIDPGLLSPKGLGYKYKRELNLNTSLDQKFYKAYLFYVNNLTAHDSKETTRYHTDVVLRSILKDYGYVTYTSSATRDNQYFGTNGIVDYIQGKIGFDNINWSLGGNTKSKSENCNYWTGTSNINGCKSKFEEAKKYYNNYKNFGLTWNNPISITPTVEKTEATDEETGYYTFNFEIKFSDGTYNFFDYSNYNNGFGMAAYFSYSLGNINDSYGLEGNTLDYSGSGYITDNNSTANIFVKISEETYNVIKNNDPNGEVFIKLNYEYYHPLSPENVFVNSYVDTLTGSTTQQRMVVFSNYIHKDVAYAGRSVDEDQIDYSYCQQNGNIFYYNGSEVSLNEYKEKCSCASINSSSITNYSMKNIYNNLCPTENSESYTSSLNRCTDSENGKNTITHSYTKSNAINEYCPLTCMETINVENFTDRYSVLAGKYFELDVYPKLMSNKNCSVDVKYNNWNTDYITLLNDEISAVNKRLRDYAINNPRSSSTISCSCGENCITYGTRYNYQYIEYSYNNSSRKITSSTKTGSYKTGDCGNTKPSTYSDSYNSNVIATKISNLNTHFNKLSACNKYLNDLGTSYYKFSGDLSFYYNQTYSKLGSVWNNNKPDGEDDDSAFIQIPSNTDDYSDGYKEESGTNFNSSSYTSDSYEYAYISSTTAEAATSSNKYIGSSQYTDYSITRIRSYSSSYEPSVSKYVDSYTGIISSRASNLKNAVSLIGSVKNNVYDTNVSTIAKTYTSDYLSAYQNYYVFKSLGDNNEIFNYYNDKTIYSTGNPLYSVDDSNKLKRYCDYEITNDIIEGCEDGSCKSKPNFVFRIVDSNNIDPNNRLLDKTTGRIIDYSENVDSTGTSNGFKNWRNEKGKTVKTAIENSDTFNPENLEYSFVLDSATIEAIREYNTDSVYCDAESGCSSLYSRIDLSGSELYCEEDGNKCKSTFIDEAMKNNSSILNTSKFALTTNGRSTWKNYEEKDGKYYIDGEKIR